MAGSVRWEPRPRRPAGGWLGLVDGVPHYWIYRAARGYELHAAGAEGEPLGHFRHFAAAASAAEMLLIVAP